MPTPVETGPCADATCKHQRVLHGVWCERHEGQKALRMARLRDLGCPEALVVSMLDGIEFDCCSRCSRPVYGGEEVCEDCLGTTARAEAAERRVHSGITVAAIILCCAALAVLAGLLWPGGGR